MHGTQNTLHRTLAALNRLGFAGAVGLIYCGNSLAAAPCMPPQGFLDTPHRVIAPAEQLISHTEVITLEQPLDAVQDIEANTKLEDAIDKNSALPNVTGTFILQGTEYKDPGARRLTCLSDGSSLVEQVLENRRDTLQAHFRYVVWNYTTKQADPIVYGVGYFMRTALDKGRTQASWIYSFALNRHRFPGYLGPGRNFLFRVGFLERQYAQMMRGTLAAGKTRIEAIARNPQPAHK